MEKIKIGVVGCGNISGIYFENLTTVFDNTEVYACADLEESKAKEAAEKWGIPHIMTLEQMLDCAEISILLVLTTPQSHYDICKRALNAGKHTYVEKPLSLDAAQGRELMALAEERGLLLGGAPDTFLGAGIQTCKKLIDAGFIGEITGASAFMVCHGHESWHPAPEFYYQKGGGPLFDMGPYYLTALVSLVGRVQEVCSMQNAAFSERLITSEPKRGKKITVEVPTHTAGLLRFTNGAVGTLVTSFDVWGSTLPRIELYGTKGALIVPDPNCFGGPVLLKTDVSEDFKEIPLAAPYENNSRGLGVSYMARCIAEGTTEHPANVKLTSHVLDIMCALDQSGDTRQFVKIG